MMMKLSYVLVLIYSPASPYFNGFSFEMRGDQTSCVAEIERRIGEEVTTTAHWEKEMMGPIPKVIGGFCAQGGFAAGAK